jgi:hypothetical protein
MAARVEGRRVLVAGIPRSGTTWAGRVLGQADGACYVHEPDNHLVRPEAWWAKRELGAYPRLVPGQEAPDYERLFRVAFAGGARPSLVYTWARALHRCVPRRDLRANREGESPEAGTRRLARGLAAPGSRAGRSDHVVVKSIFCARSLEWLAERFEPAVVVVERHPFAVIGSWAELGWSGFLDADPSAVAECRAAFGVEPPRTGSWVDRAAWHFGFLSALLGRARDRHPDWQVLRHETLCAGPEAGFEDLCDRLGLRFGAAARRFLLASNRPGKGYSTNRVWAEQLGARRRLTPYEQERVTEILSRFTAAPAAPRRVPAPAPAAASSLVHTRR